ncbi:efflux RND transporter periplasmic adaptor subunit [Leptospira kanakyensis]|uniref:HlyD family efflux transporter periplasmic adaptor subunit n=1 Tax=Leptospira kanakyensis TaxID=2484968 RepID=A0A6N4QLM7_9LEPT|nr:HlyD family efflux transporter periplasmic adaptor subunit [Leptospira kanakyensis]MCW7482618.1 efflux RND transporter periplasmic adaptor subunit [Leptospira kanakyensis]TGK55320.1 HlyD family efflux transporter periplasmic adaptor subunit [Leptospira kanakyensis]TGK60854.1 HlyD family efflux transporter periplasmic adaptor subunit [Leptospira kanakyensis]TGK76671.1 HlyD family efflux transporter periplasmic adaptor subunit [Leptospira kanakyensis]
MDRKKLYFVLVSFVIILILLFSFFFRTSKTNRVLVERGSLVEAVYALGTVKPVDNFSLKFGIAASVREIFVEEGQTVKKGQALLTNDSGITFRSPLDGTLTKLNVAKNETAMPGLPLLEIQNLKSVYISVSLDQESALRVKPGMRVQLSFESIRGNVYQGKVERIYPSNGQFLVRIEADELPEGILPDMTTDVAIAVSSKENVVLVPLVAVDRGKVTRFREGNKDKIEIRIGAINSEFGELLQGDLKEGDEVLVKN